MSDTTAQPFTVQPSQTVLNNAQTVRENFVVLKAQVEARQKIVKEEFAKLETELKKFQEEFNTLQKQLDAANQSIGVCEYILSNPEAAAEPADNDVYAEDEVAEGEEDGP